MGSRRSNPSVKPGQKNPIDSNTIRSSSLRDYTTRAPEQDAHLLVAFRQGLRENGYVEGRNVTIEYRWAEGHYDRLPALAADLARRQVTVITANSQATVAAKAITSTIPIVFITGADPVQVGFITSLNRLGGNLTGLTSLDTQLGRKRLQLLHEPLPTARKLATLVNPTFPGSDIQTRDLQSAASALGLQLHALYASTELDMNAVFIDLSRLQANGLVIGNDPFFNSWSEQLGALALRPRMPAIYEFRAFVEAGGLISYGGSISDLYRLFGVYTGRILKGEKPADLPVQQATKVEMIINLRTAKTLGLTIPLPLIGRADEVIE